MNIPSLATQITLFLCGDVMIGRGIDQVLPYHADPILYESYVKDATIYVKLAEKVNGPIQQPVAYSQIWGYSKEILSKQKPDLRIINLETSLTISENWWKGKGINYRAHPKNVALLKEVKIDYAMLANNHILDWGYEGMEETMNTLINEKIWFGGIGNTKAEAKKPCVIEIPQKGRLIILAYGSPSSGVPFDWKAQKTKPGVNFLPDYTEETVIKIGKIIKEIKKKNDIVLFSVHWGSNWGYPIPIPHSEFAHKLIDIAGVDIIHGHSSHHFLGLEVYNEKLIIQGCGDFINDYEGIGGNEEYRAELALMYFPCINAENGNLLRLNLVPVIMNRFQLKKVAKEDAKWIADVLNREGKKIGGTSVVLDEKELWLSLIWKKIPSKFHCSLNFL